MSVWFAIPSARPEAEVLPIIECWQNFGYKVALVRDELLPNGIADYQVSFKPYLGYAVSVNHLAKEILKRDPHCQWVCTGGDDTLPDPNKTADEIAFECGRHFGELHQEYRMEPIVHGGTNQTARSGEARMPWSTFGVMQPTGDRFAQGSIDRIAGSPWMGREWCLRANGGAGPLWPEFTHCFVDECLQRTAQKLGVFWQRRDLIHMHMHFMRQSEDINSPATRTAIPPHLVRWNSRAHWDEMQAIFKRLEAQDFAPCMPLPVEVCA